MVISVALIVGVPQASTSWPGECTGHLHRVVADWDCIVRKLVRVAGGRVKPGHDVKVKPGHDVKVKSSPYREGQARP